MSELGSDHLGILFSIQGTSITLVDNPIKSTERFNTKLADWEKFRTKLQALSLSLDLSLGLVCNLDYLRESRKGLQGQDTNTYQLLDYAASTLTDNIVLAAKASIPIYCPSSRAKP